MQKYTRKNDPNITVLVKPMTLDVYSKIRDPKAEDLPAEEGYWVEFLDYPVQPELLGKAKGEVVWYPADVFPILFELAD